MANTRAASAVLRTPFGWVGVAVSGKGVVRVLLPKKNKKQAERAITNAETGGAAGVRLLKAAVKQLQGFFSGEVKALDLPLDLHHATDFQRAVWKAAVSIPYGETRSYGWIANRIKRPKAARAVGQAMGANPVPILVP